VVPAPETAPAVEAIAPDPDTSPGVGFDHRAWDGLLRQFVRHGEVDYPGLMAHRDVLDGYLNRVATADPSAWPREEQMAFWINAYNALMVQLVLEHWPLESVLEVGRLLGIIPTASIFREKRRVAGLSRSLDDIEHRVLRGRYGDPRIHAAVNCASMSCPPLRGEAYLGDRLDAQLEDAMRHFIHDESRNRVFDTPPQLSAIFKWYGKDFETGGGTVWDYVRGWLTEEERSRVAVRTRPGFLSYDWALNCAPR
jgi:hypothetical protein